MRQFILRWAGGWPKTKTVATELTDHCVTRFYSLVSVTHFTFSHLQKRNDPITKYRWKSCVMQRGLAMDVAGVCVSVQTDMVKTHMATGRNTPPQQHLWWLTIHSGKRRRFVVYTTQKKNSPCFAPRDSATSQLHTRTRLITDRFSDSWPAVHICIWDCQL